MSDKLLLNTFCSVAHVQLQTSSDCWASRVFCEHSPEAKQKYRCCGMQVMEEKVTNLNVDVACVVPETGYKLYSKAEVADIISRI